MRVGLFCALLSLRQLVVLEASSSRNRYGAGTGGKETSLGTLRSGDTAAAAAAVAARVKASGGGRDAAGRGARHSWPPGPGGQPGRGLNPATTAAAAEAEVETAEEEGGAEAERRHLQGRSRECTSIDPVSVTEVSSVSLCVCECGYV